MQDYLKNYQIYTGNHIEDEKTKLLINNIHNITNSKKGWFEFYEKNSSIIEKLTNVIIPSN